MPTTEQPEETLSEGATLRAPGASAGLSAEETEDGQEPKALASSQRPAPLSPPAPTHAVSADEASPFASLKRTVLPVLPSTERQGATTEAYSVRLPTELKRRLMEAVQREGGRAAPLFEQLLEAHESKREEANVEMAEKFVLTRLNVEGHLRALMVTLTADLRDLAADEEAHEAEAADLACALQEAKRQAAQEREAIEAKERRSAQERAAGRRARGTARVAARTASFARRGAGTERGGGRAPRKIYQAGAEAFRSGATRCAHRPPPRRSRAETGARCGRPRAHAAEF